MISFEWERLMKPSEKGLFGEMLAAVSAIYGREFTAPVIAIYWGALQGYDLSAVRQAFDRHVKNPDTGQFMPKPADLIRMMSGTSADSAMAAWAKVDAAVRKVGTWRDVAFDDAVIHRVVQEMGGWIAFGTRTDDDWPFVAKEFENRYRSYRARNETPDYPSVLIGLAGAQNRREGLAIEPPTLIGDAQKAAAVMGSGSTSPLVAFTRADALLPVPTAPRLKG